MLHSENNRTVNTYIFQEFWNLVRRFVVGGLKLKARFRRKAVFRAPTSNFMHGALKVPIYSEIFLLQTMLYGSSFWHL